MKHPTFFVSVALFTLFCFLEAFSPLFANPQHFKQDEMKAYTIIQKDSIHLVGIECRTSNAPEDAPHDIPKLWEKFYREDFISRIPHKLSSEVMALYCDYEGDYTKPYSLVIGCPVSAIENIPEGMVSKIIPGGPYALFRAIGEHPSSLIKTWGNVWQTPLKRTYTGDYEFYGEKFSNDPQEVEVYIAIENESL